MHISEVKYKQRSRFLNRFKPEKKPYRIINRTEKGLIMYFFSDCVIKEYSGKPEHPDISKEDQIHRFKNEIAAYQRFNALNCTFVPELIDFSFDERWFCIARVKGFNLLELSQFCVSPLPYKSILSQIDKIVDWLEFNSFPDMENNIKDLVLNESGKLYLVDFETYTFNKDRSMKSMFYNHLIFDILERIFIRTSRKAQFTPCFVNLSLCIIFRKPVKTLLISFRLVFLKVYSFVCRIRST